MTSVTSDANLDDINNEVLWQSDRIIQNKNEVARLKFLGIFTKLNQIWWALQNAKLVYIKKSQDG